MRAPIIIGTRGSALALYQTNWVRNCLIAGGLAVELQVIRTTGDKITDAPLARIGGKGVFTKEIEEALLNGQIDLAVHSMKDLPTSLPDGLIVGAITSRADVRDVLISRAGIPFQELRRGAIVGTSSLRRQAQLRHARPDLQFTDLRGNLDTRLRKLDAGMYDAIVLAAAGLERMGWQSRITEYLSLDLCLPAPGQGALGLEIRDGDPELATAISSLDDLLSHRIVSAERAFLRGLGGGCQVPIGALGQIQDNHLRLDGIVASVDGTSLVWGCAEGPPDNSDELGYRLARELLAKGAVIV
jgi:hydroxymethylbilane synthase